MKAKKQSGENQMLFGDAPPKKESPDKYHNICTNASCRLRKAGCRGFEGCPGFQSQ